MSPRPSVDARRELLTAAEHLRSHQQLIDADDPDVEELTTRLYGSWYARVFPKPAPPAAFPTDLVQVLRAVDATAHTWETGWTVDRAHPDGRVIARRGGEVRMADRCDYVVVGAPGSAACVGDEIEVAGRRDRIDPDGDWWRTAGRRWRFTRPVPGIVRVYWNIGLEMLPVLVGQLTGLLAGSDRPWMAKAATAPDAHVRADATVLYLHHDLLVDVRSGLDEIVDAVGPGLVDGVPPLSLPIARGVAVALEPGDGSSFGEHRARLVVQALVEHSTGSPDQTLAAIAASFAGADIDIDRPWTTRSAPRVPWER